MKKSYIFLIVISLWTSIAVNAQNLIAVHNNNSPSFYSSLDSAMNHANNGDTIYLPGGSFTFNGPISKQLHIVGVGYNPSTTNATNYTYLCVNAYQNSIHLLPGASDGSISGVVIPGTLFLGSYTGCVTSYFISRCKIESIYSREEYAWACNPANVTITECIISSIGFQGGENIRLFNNILGSIGGLGNNSVIKNNIFLSNTYSIAFASYGSITNSRFENNIFLSTELVYSFYSNLFSNNTFNNNLFTQNISFPYQNTTSIGINNIIDQSQSSIFINQSGSNFSFSNDYHLKSTCPGKNAGRDGTDIGIYGGAYPWKDGSIPFNPHFRSILVNSSTEPNGNLNVNIQVEAQNR